MTTKQALNQVARIEISFIPKIDPTLRPIVKTAQDAYSHFINHWNMGHIYLMEELYVMLLNTKGAVMGIYPLTKGNEQSTLVNFKLISLLVVGSMARGVILAHNHPSGDLLPGLDDKNSTQKMKQILTLYDVKLIDHLIISPNGFFSFCEDGLL